jgi:hypothetical protein
MIARSPDFEKLASLMGKPHLSASSAPNGWGKPVLKRPMLNVAPQADTAIKLAGWTSMVGKLPMIGKMLQSGARAAPAVNRFAAGGLSSFAAHAGGPASYAANAPVAGMAGKAFSGARNWLNTSKVPKIVTGLGIAGAVGGSIGSSALSTYATTRGMTDYASGLSDGGAGALAAVANASPFQKAMAFMFPDAAVNEGLKATAQSMPWMAKLMGGQHYLNRTADGYKRITEAFRAGHPLQGIDKMAPVGGMPQYTQGAGFSDYANQLTNLQKQFDAYRTQAQQGVGATALPQS